MRASLDSLIKHGLVAPNPGYGHPLRPEYLLTAAGERIAPVCLRLDTVLAAGAIRDLGLRKWSMPVLDALRDGPRRFGELSLVLAGATDRALSRSLADLEKGLLVSRSVLAARPPASLYAHTGTGRELGAVLGDLDGL